MVDAYFWKVVTIKYSKFENKIFLSPSLFEYALENFIWIW